MPFTKCEPPSDHRSSGRSKLWVESVDVVGQMEGSLRSKSLKSRFDYCSNSMSVYCLHCRDKHAFLRHAMEDGPLAVVKVSESNVRDLTRMESGHIFEPFKARQEAVWTHELHQKPQGHSVHVARSRRERCVDVGVGIYPKHAEVFVSAQHTCDASHCNAVITTQGEYEAPRINSLLHLVIEEFICPPHKVTIAGASAGHGLRSPISKGCDVHRNIAHITVPPTEPAHSASQPRAADELGASLSPIEGLSQLHGSPNDLDRARRLDEATLWNEGQAVIELVKHTTHIKGAPRLGHQAPKLPVSTAPRGEEP
mmetsp:Transcript_418/g.1400  ORF Transcript_418/g.1400 Transcript_418/m.1400 type:complete len:311 (+) Transcript_418:273-1205(+)